MGAILSSKSKDSEKYVVQQGQPCKRQKTSSIFYEDNPQLIPTLPDEISIQILARIPKRCYLNVRLVSRRWKATIMSSEIYKVRKELGTTEEWLYILTKLENEKYMWYALDPVSGQWQRLPSMPNVPGEEGSSKRGLAGLRMWNIVGSTIRVSDAIRGWLGRGDPLDRMPFWGCAVAAVDGSIYVLGGFSKVSTMSSVWRFDPIQNKWSEMTSMSLGRAYCKTGILNGKLYVVGGVTKDHGGLVPLQSAEVYDPCSGVWSEVPTMPFAKAHLLPTAFLAGFLKPIATGMTSYRGKLYVPQSLYCWPFFVDVGGEVYDPETNQWEEMPAGMGEGWPARQAGTKLSVVVENDLYALEPSRSLDSAKIKLYDQGNDTWKVRSGDVSIRDVTDAETPYLLAGCLGKLHVITKDRNCNITVMQAERRRNVGPTSSNSSAESSNMGGSETNFWKVIASRRGGSEELVSCQILNI